MSRQTVAPGGVVSFEGRDYSAIYLLGFVGCECEVSETPYTPTDSGIATRVVLVDIVGPPGLWRGCYAYNVAGPERLDGGIDARRGKTKLAPSLGG